MLVDVLVDVGVDLLQFGSGLREIRLDLGVAVGTDAERRAALAGPAPLLLPPGAASGGVLHPADNTRAQRTA